MMGLGQADRRGPLRCEMTVRDESVPWLDPLSAFVAHCSAEATYD